MIFLPVLTWRSTMSFNANFKANTESADRVQEKQSSNSHAADLSSAVWHPSNAGAFRGLVQQVSDEGKIYDKNQLELPLPRTKEEITDLIREQHNLVPLMYPKLTD
jgi:hypothetical protein